MTASDAFATALARLGAGSMGGSALGAFLYPEVTRKAAEYQHQKARYEYLAHDLNIDPESADEILRESIQAQQRWGYEDDRMWQAARDKVIALTAPPAPTREELWAAALPDVAALGDDSPHVSVRQLPSGELVWSWVRRGERVYEQQQEVEQSWQQKWAVAEMLRQIDGTV